jgi:branched-chain amino acid transport system permease protein
MVGFLSLRARGVHLLIITLALANVLYEIYARPNNFTGGPSGLSKVPFVKLFMTIELNRDTTFFLLLAMLFVLIVITMNIINSPAGRALLAMNNSESLAQAMGISILKYRIFAFVVATEYAFLAGAMYIAYMRASNATTWILTLGLNILTAVTLGGSVKPSGSIMGSFILFGLDLAILKNIPYFQKNSSASLIFSGVLIILIVVKYPGGLSRMLVDIRSFAQRTIAKRRLYKYGEDE